MKFQKGNVIPHKLNCRCFRCSKIPWNKGKKLSLQHRKRLSETHKGFKRSKESIEKQRKWIKENNPLKGKKFSTETKEKMKEAKLKNPIRYWLGKKRTDITKEKNPNWKGGINNKSQYILIYNPEHPFANQRYVPEHRLVMEKYLGRYLTKKEIVHHIDGNKKNNKIDNLLLCKDSHEHQIIHDKLKQLVFELYKKEIIKFNKEKKEYFILWSGTAILGNGEL